MGAFKANVPLTVAGALGVVVAAVYGLFLMQRSFQGTPNPGVSSMRDFGLREMSVMALMMAGLIWIGIHPQELLDMSAPVVEALWQDAP